MLSPRGPCAPAVVHVHPDLLDPNRGDVAKTEPLLLEGEPAVDPSAKHGVYVAWPIELGVLLDAVPAVPREKTVLLEGPGPVFAPSIPKVPIGVKFRYGLADSGWRKRRLAATLRWCLLAGDYPGPPSRRSRGYSAICRRRSISGRVSVQAESIARIGGEAPSLGRRPRFARRRASRRPCLSAFWVVGAFDSPTDARRRAFLSFLLVLPGLLRAGRCRRACADARRVVAVWQ